MPKASVHNAIARQWELLKILPTNGLGITAAELTQKLTDAEFQVTKRSVERDLLELEKVLGIRCDAGSKPYRWYKSKAHALDLPGMDFADALSLALAEKFLSSLAPVVFQKILEPKFAQARNRLATTKNNYAAWANKVRYVSPSLPLIPPKIEFRVLSTVQEAIAKERQLSIRYSSTDKPTQDITLHPLGFVQRGPIAYLIATAFGYNDPRPYALHRIHAVNLLNEPSQRPSNFSLDAFLESGGMEFGGGNTIRLKAEVSDMLACYLTESPLAPDQKLKSLGADKYLLTAKVRDSWQLSFWILSQGPAITVLQPSDLKIRVRESLQETLSGYRGR